MKTTYIVFLLSLVASGVTLTAEEANDKVVSLEPLIIAENTAGAASPGTQITTLTAQTLETVHFTELTDLIAFTPNLRAGGGGLRSFGDILQMRGIGNTPYFSNPGVLVVVDGVAQGDVFNTPTGLLDVERIEIYRGPQPTLQGRSAPAGTIQIITRQPTNDLRGRVFAEYSRFDTYEAGASVSAPMVKDTFYVSASADYSTSEGFIKNSTLGRTADTRQSTAGRVNFVWTPDQTWEIALAVNAEKNNDGAQRIVPLTNDWNSDASDLAGESDSRRDSETLRVSKEFDGLRLSLISARQDWKLDPFSIDYDFSAFPFVTSQLSQQQRQFSQEIRLESDPNADEPLSWSIGGIYYTTTTKGEFLREYNFGAPEFDQTAHKITERGGSVYGQVSYAVLPDLELSAGLRADHVQKSLHREGATNLGPAADIDRSRRDRDYEPMLAVSWQPVESLKLTARHARSMQAGGFSAYTSVPQYVEFEDERVSAWETGAIWEPIANRLRVELSTFYYTIKNYQVERSFTNVDYIVFNAPKATSKGVELETIATPIDGLELSASAGILDVTFDEYLDPSTGQDFKGNKAPYAPNFTLALSAAYTVQSGPLKDLSGRVGYRLIGETYFNEANDAVYRDAGYGLLDARISYQIQGWSVYLFGSNLTDDRHHEFILPELFAGVPGAPRTYGVGTAYSW